MSLEGHNGKLKNFRFDLMKDYDDSHGIIGREVSCLVFSPASHILIVGLSNGNLLWFNPVKEKGLGVVRTFKTKNKIPSGKRSGPWIDNCDYYTNAIMCIDFSLDGSMFVSGSKSGRVHLWSIYSSDSKKVFFRTSNAYFVCKNKS